MQENHEELLNTLVADMKLVSTNLEKLTTEVRMLGDIEVKNGGGRKIKFNRAEFFQMLYEKGKVKNMLNDLDWWISKIIPLSTLIILVYTFFIKK